jgi:hypothetical protein
MSPPLLAELTRGTVGGMGAPYLLPILPMCTENRFSLTVEHQVFIQTDDKTANWRRNRSDCRERPKVKMPRTTNQTSSTTNGVSLHEDADLWRDQARVGTH